MATATLHELAAEFDVSAEAYPPDRGQGRCTDARAGRLKAVAASQKEPPSPLFISGGCYYAADQWFAKSIPYTCFPRFRRRSEVYRFIS